MLFSSSLVACTGCACFIFVFDDFEMDVVQLSEEELLQKHRKERKELQGIIQALKKSCTKGDKKKKKEVTEEIIRLELELEKGQNEELFHLKQEAAVCEEPANEDCRASQHALRVSKAQRRRDKKASRERQRENMIKAQEAENIHGPRNLEIQKIKHILKERSLMIQEIPSDGNCLYCAVDDQLKLLDGGGLGTKKLREMAGQYLKEHKSDFVPFLSHPDTGDLLTDEQYEDYCNEVVNTSAWGGEVELRALSHVLKYCIEVIQATGPSVLVGEEYQDKKQAILTFHRHMYGLGEHYNSTKPILEEEAEDTESS